MASFYYSIFCEGGPNFCYDLTDFREAVLSSLFLLRSYYYNCKKYRTLLQLWQQGSWQRCHTTIVHGVSGAQRSAVYVAVSICCSILASPQKDRFIDVPDVVNAVSFEF